MRIDLLPQLNSYKANLHCHSTISDGKKLPEQLRDDYRAHGYSVLSITDHNLLVDHSDLNMDDFLLITGYEADISPDKSSYNGFGNHTPTCHINFLAKKPDNTYIPLYNPNYVWRDNHNLKPSQKFLGDGEYQRSFTNINGFVKAHTDNGFLAVYNHPDWSLQDMQDICRYEGFYAMEICNYGCVNGGYFDINDYVFESLLRRGKKWFAVATDDNHNFFPDGNPMSDSYGGFQVIRAESLTYDNIISALEKGNFYASMGPEIKEFYVEGEGDEWYAHIKTSPVEAIAFRTYGRRTGFFKGDFVGDLRTEATWKLQPRYDRYVRAWVKDEKGRYAWTNAYFDPCKMENGKFDYASYMYQ